MNNFGDEVKRLREELGVSQQTLGERVGITQGAIGHFEANRRVPGGDVLFRLARALGVECGHFEAFLAPADEPPADPPPAKGKRGGKK